jgi:2-polyprenyl-3-methyl-5-hydroxy-6-metoxy-1,4-benzoquinol methylase
MLLFRYPTTTARENESFYQDQYSEGFTTQLPSNDALATLIETNFSGGEKDYSRNIEILRSLGVPNGARVLDFGCSWGYGSHQLVRGGYQVTGFEISKPRCTFAQEKLRIDAYSSLDEVTGPFDLVFSSHVVEHLPSVGASIAELMVHLKPGGLFVAFTPNGSYEFRRVQPTSWMRFWGDVHPNLLDAEFYRKAFANHRYLLASSPFNVNALREWGLARIPTELDLSGDELLVVVEKPIG